VLCSGLVVVVCAAGAYIGKWCGRKEGSVTGCALRFAALRWFLFGLCVGTGTRVGEFPGDAHTACFLSDVISFNVARHQGTLRKTGEERNKLYYICFFIYRIGEFFKDSYKEYSFKNRFYR
jgi:hypothetical protein